MQRWSESFASTLVGFTLPTLEAHPSPVFGITPRGELAYCNPAFLAFAEDNGTPEVLARYPIGSDFLGAIAGDARSSYAARLGEVMDRRSPWFHDYTCTSHERDRKYRRGAYPLKNGGGLILSSSLTVEGAPASAPHSPEPTLEARYVQSTGLLTQCSNCRRTLRNDGSDAWDWVPAWAAEAPAHTSHSICGLCFEYHWKR